MNIQVHGWSQDIFTPPPLNYDKRPGDLLNEQFGGLSVCHGQVIFIPTQLPNFFHPIQYLINGELFV